MNKKYIISETLNFEQIQQLYDLYQKMWWSKDRTTEEINTSLITCLPIAALESDTDNLIGFARVLSDEMRYAYIFDVMTFETYQSQGIGKLLMNYIFTHPKLKNVKYFELTCAPEMAGYYEKFGFSQDYGKVTAMRKTRIAII